MASFFGVQNIKVLASADVGYLVPQNKGVDGLAGNYTRGSRNPTYILVDDLLKRTNKPVKETKPTIASERLFAMRSLTKRDSIKQPNRLAEMIEQIQGSANPDSALLSFIKRSAS